MKFVNKQGYIDEYEKVILLDNARQKLKKAIVELHTDFPGTLKVTLP